MTGLSAFDTTVQKSNVMINEVAEELKLDDKHRAFQLLRGVLHVLRDRLTDEEAVQLGAQLPILIAGFYYENWRLAATPTKERSKEEFLVRVIEEINKIDQSEQMDSQRATEVVRGVFKVVAQEVSTGEIDDVVKMFPAELRDLWPETVRS